MSFDPEAESCLANMAGLLILNEFDSLVGNLFDLKVKGVFPKLEMIDGLLKDKFTPKN